MTGFNENGVNEILLRSIIHSGFEKTFTDVVFPFLKRVGVLWHTGSVNAGAEHFISNIFRRRLIAAIDSLPPSTDPGRKKVLFFLPENELHEIGLLFYTYLVRNMGHETLYLGQSTPFNAIENAVERWHPDILVTGALSALPFTKPEDYLKHLSTSFAEKKILVSGTLAYVKGIKSLPNLFAVQSVEKLKNSIIP